MANTKSAAKRARQIQRRTKNNKPVISLLKSQLRAIREAVEGSKKAEVVALLPKVSAALDRAAKTGRIHKNKANRHKGALAKSLAGLN